MAFASPRLIRAGWVSFTPCFKPTQWPDRYNPRDFKGIFISDADEAKNSDEAASFDPPTQVVDLTRCVIPECLIRTNSKGQFDFLAKMDEGFSYDKDCHTREGDKNGFRLGPPPKGTDPVTDLMIYPTLLRSTPFQVDHKEYTVFDDETSAKKSKGQSDLNPIKLIEVKIDNPTDTFFCKTVSVAIPSSLWSGKIGIRSLLVMGACSKVKHDLPIGYVYFEGVGKQCHQSKAVYDQVILK